MKISKAGRKLLTSLEGYRNNRYLDSSGYPTIGVGHLITNYDPNLVTVTGKSPSQVQRITNEQVDKLLELDLHDFAERFSTALPAGTTQNQFDAITSLAHNIGAGGLLKSTFLRLFREGDTLEAANAMLLFSRSAGNRVAGLYKRRHVERAIFLDSIDDLGDFDELPRAHANEVKVLFNKYKTDGGSDG